MGRAKSIIVKYVACHVTKHGSDSQAVGRAKSIIVKHVACHVTKHSSDSQKENMLPLLTGLGKGYCCILLPQIRPEGKVLSSQTAFCTHMTIIANVLLV